VNANRPTGDIVIELSRYVFETLREDEECAFCRGRKDDGELTGILLVAPVSERPVPGILERLEHEYSLPHCGYCNVDIWLSGYYCKARARGAAQKRKLQTRNL
jgi:hypothetical protein